MIVGLRTTVMPHCEIAVPSMDGSTSEQARHDWDRARRSALWAAVVDTLTRRHGALLPLEDVKKRLTIRGSQYRGLRQVPLHNIIGSEGRYADFDRRFLPRSGTTAQRWMSVAQAQYEDVPLPAIELYKIGDVYFVKDGNHRVSVARQRGQHDIDAYVTEYEVDVPLDPSISPAGLLLKAEYSDFLARTSLGRLRPQQRIEFTELGGYDQLIEHIHTHRYYLSLERGGDVPADAAVESWYDNVYVAVGDAIRTHNILAGFPGRTEADLYLWIMHHRAVLLEEIGVDPGPDVATLDYAERFQPPSLLDTIGGTLEAVARTADALTNLQGTRASEAHPVITRPSDVEGQLTDATDVDRLRQHLADHQAYLATRWERPVGRDEALQDWYSNFYLPTIEAIQEQRLLADWPGRTEADLYVAVMEQMEALKRTDSPASLGERAVALHEHLLTAGATQWQRLLDYLHQRLRPTDNG